MEEINILPLHPTFAAASVFFALPVFFIKSVANFRCVLFKKSLLHTTYIT